MGASDASAALHVGCARIKTRGWLAAYASFELAETGDKIERREEVVFMADEEVNRWLVR